MKTYGTFDSPSNRDKNSLRNKNINFKNTPAELNKSNSQSPLNYIYGNDSLNKGVMAKQLFNIQDFNEEDHLKEKLKNQYNHESQQVYQRAI
jgi:hypothetical protein